MKKFRVFIVLALLVVFPIVSWLYLQRGMDYRKEILNDLADLGTIVEFEIDYGTAEPFHSSVYPEKLVIATFFDPTNNSDKALMGPLLQKLHEQFDERDDLLFISNLKSGNELFLNRFAEEYAITDREQMLFNLIPPSRWDGYTKAYYQISEESYSAYGQKPFLLLIDQGGRVKRIYDAANKEDIKKLIAQTAMILPVKNERELIFKREAEK